MRRSDAFRVPRRSGAFRLPHPWLIVTLVVLVGGTAVVLNNRTQPHHVKAVFVDAFNIYPGLDVKANGLDIGRISQVQYQNGEAIVRLGIDAPSYWPLHVGTTATVRWGTTIGSGTRYVAIVPGPKSAPVLPEDGIISSQYTTPAVNVDQVLNALNGRVRSDLQNMQGNLATGLSGNSAAMNEGIHATPPALGAAASMFSELDADSNALKGLVSNGDRTMAVLAGRAAGVQDLITVAARTFDVFASNTQALQGTLVQLPTALSDTRGTLTRLDSSVSVLGTLVSDLRPGAARLVPLAQTARPALSDLHSSVPPLLGAVHGLTAAAPSLTKTLTLATPFLQQSGTLSTALTPMLACVRPYTPELAGAVVGLDGWFEGYQLEQPYDPQQPGLIRYGQAQTNGLAQFHGGAAVPTVGPYSFHSYPPGISPATFAKVFQKAYAFPRPPGMGVGKPIFLPQCGITQAALNPADDPEIGMP